MDDKRLFTVESRCSVAETIDRLAHEALSAGLMVFARIDHAVNAREVGEDLRPMELWIIGHPHGGTPLMLDRQMAGIDLPVKALEWQDVSGRVFLTYNDASWFSRRHGARSHSAETISAINAGLAMLAQAVTPPNRQVADWAGEGSDSGGNVGQRAGR